jgi:16S rRNA (guanine527-N7)-methyltransferase
VIYKPEPGAVELLATYARLVGAWAPRTDLVSERDLPRFEQRHVDDSLRLLELVSSAPLGPAADVGSGAGLPGVPLAICDPGREWHLIEPRRKRAAFLEEVVRELDLPNVVVLAITAEEAARDPAFGSNHSIAVARALAAPAVAFDLILPLVAPGGLAAVMIGRAEAPPNSTTWATGIATVRAR